jgi:hypothetical protein
VEESHAHAREKNHPVILGWSSSVFTIIDDRVIVVAEI